MYNRIKNLRYMYMYSHTCIRTYIRTYIYMDLWDDKLELMTILKDPDVYLIL